MRCVTNRAPSRLRTARAALIWGTTLGVCLAAAPNAQAQARSVVLARVTDGESGRPLADAQLRLANTAFTSRSDSAGDARLARVPAGSYTVEVRRVGYEPAEVGVTLSGADTLALDIVLERAASTLEAVTVTGERSANGLEQFEARRARGFGQFIGPTTLAAEGSRDLGDVLAGRLRGVRVVTGRDGVSRYFVSQQTTDGALRGGASAGSASGRDAERKPPGACVMHVYLDGIFIVDQDVSFLDTRSIAAVEAYGSVAPPEFRRAGSRCGVILLWSRRES
jgi:hypothetical protein